MKNKLLFIALVAIIGFSFAACDAGSGNNGGTTTQTVTTPTANPQEGTYTTAQSVTLSTATVGAAIRYTTDGTAPTNTSAFYSGAISISATTTLKAIAVKEGMNDSGILTALYTINIPVPDTVATPTANPQEGTYTTAQSVTLSTATVGAAIHYTIDGTDPTNASALYSEEINISATTTLKAIAVKEGMNDSGILTALYTINIPVPDTATPTANPPQGTYLATQSVTLSVATPGAAIRYTTDGTAPTNASKLYSGAISISATTTLKAIAVKEGMNDSGILTAVYTITLPQWTVVSDSKFGTSDIWGIAYGNNKFVAVGSDGKMATSTDGVTWTAVSNSTFGTNRWIYAIAYGNNKFVAGGDYGKMATSTDGVTWTTVTNSTFGSNDIWAIAYDNNKFVAGGEGGKIATSTDGTTWTAVSNSTFGTSDIRGIAYGNDKFVAVRDSGKMATSTDGTTWTAVSNSTFGTSDIWGIAYGNGIFIAGGGKGKMATSTDGTTWTEVSTNPFGSSTIMAITYGNNTFVAVSDSGRIGVSTNGTRWTGIRENNPFYSGFVNFDGDPIYAIAYGNGKFVAGGKKGKMAYSADN